MAASLVILDNTANSSTGPPRESWDPRWERDIGRGRMNGFGERDMCDKTYKYTPASLAATAAVVTS